MNSNGCLIVLTGPSGTGKSSILHYMEQNLGVELAPKHTSRPSRHTEEDERDFIFCRSNEFPSERILRFDSYGHVFGVPLDPIDQSIRRGKVHATIVGDYDTVAKLTSIYKGKSASILVFCESHILKERILRDTSSQRALRWSLISKELSSIYDQLGCVDMVVNNSGALEDTFSKIREIVSQLIGSKETN